jgi:hypothetical protein
VTVDDFFMKVKALRLDVLYDAAFLLVGFCNVVGLVLAGQLQHKK